MKKTIIFLFTVLFVFCSANMSFSQKDIDKQSLYKELSKTANLKIFYYNSTFNIRDADNNDIITVNYLEDESFIAAIKKRNIQKNLVWIVMAKTMIGYPDEILDMIQKDLQSLGFKRVVFQQAASESAYYILRDSDDFKKVEESNDIDEKLEKEEE